MFTKSAIAAMSCLFASASAEAGFINYLDLPKKESFVALDIDGIDVTVQAVNGTFKTRRKGYKAGTGVSHGKIKRLIDNSEAIVFTFSEPVYVDMLAINRLFSRGHRKDKPNERALVITDAGEFMLEAMSRSEAKWTGPGDANEMMIAEIPMGGRRMIHSHDEIGGIFNEPVTRIELCSGLPGPRYKFSDFSFVGLEFVPAPSPGPESVTIEAPAPATLPALLALGAAAARRRRPSSA